ncbi:hypothetical protein HIM_10952 [Hirsutella minnesotensis 3608]|uniref:Enoyl-CoA hydratase n=1 Tax=Hirsutella minnesotensis 3608 TaxID=1043627 RepID=A0A0F7ZQP4_9HYPO|nr:hypothetical protein HIM_12391 [Hirsutella minnesotensis 3608]KJZ69657.1 hypothetical protein HIM_10952 [Hirsutella minnesotensis 3608]
MLGICLSNILSPLFRTAEVLPSLHSTFTALSDLPIPTISAISSLALGGGLELALSTHFRVLASNATVALGLPETRLGIIPGAGGTHRLPALIGLGRARDLILTGRRVAAPEAYFLGIADRVVEVIPEKGDSEGKNILPAARKIALAEAMRLAQEICECGPVPLEWRCKLSRGQGQTRRTKCTREMSIQRTQRSVARFSGKEKAYVRGSAGVDSKSDGTTISIV